MFSQARHRHVLGVVLLALCFGIASARPLGHNTLQGRAVDLVARQQTTTTAVAPSDTSGSTNLAPTRTRSRTRDEPGTMTEASSTIPTTVRSVLATSTSPTTTSATPSSNTHTSRTSTPPITSIARSSTFTSASATATSSPHSTSIFAADSPYRTYAIAVTVAVSIFGFLLLILFIRFLKQCFSKKPQHEPITTNIGADGWRYSRDSNPYSGPIPNSASTTQTTPEVRHKDISDAEMSERHAFLSTDSVTLYPAAKSDSERYNDEEFGYANRMRSFSSSSGSGSQTAVPFVSRRPTSMSFLHSPSATHPAFVVHPGSDASHSDEAQASTLRAVPEEPAAAPNSTQDLLLARASVSDPYRQQTLAPGTVDLSRAASTASAYSQQSAYSSVPPIPVLPAQHARPSRTQLSPDISAALSSMQRSRNGSTDTLHTFKTTAPPTEEGTAAPSAFPRDRPGRMGWGGRAPSSIHGPDLYFGHSH
ncbi:hypothetical protein FRC08_017978 [Ceratobasidium sp. 394]|nr:hypothetical protein FRC08_017978 [Ceratobasidium sp. 394]